VFEEGNDLRISFLIRFDLCNPVFSTRFGEFSLAAIVSVPEASMDEYSFPSARKDEVWPPGKVSSMQPVSIAETMQEMANSQFGSGIAGAHAFHNT
jgi:hypothetical protein